MIGMRHRRPHIRPLALFCVIYAACAVAEMHAQSGHSLERDLKFAHLTTNDGLSQGYVTSILQDRRGFMWFATRDGLNRYDGNAFVVYKHNPNDPHSLSSSFLQDLIEDDHGYLWISTNTGLNKFDPVTERFTRYLPDPGNPGSLAGSYVTGMSQDGRGFLWCGTQDGGLNRLDPATGTFTHYRTDSEGRFVGRITHVIADSHGDIWFVGERGLVHVNPRSGEITRPPAIRNALSADSVSEDNDGNLWMLANSPVVGLVKYDRKAERLTTFPLMTRGAGLASTNTGGSLTGRLAADGEKGFWCPSSDGLAYFDRRTERFTDRFRHDETNADSLDTNAVMSVYQDRSGVLWVGTENAGINILNFRQEQFGHFRHHPSDPGSLSPGRVKAIYQDPKGGLWVGFFPRALDRVDRKTGKITHYRLNQGEKNAIGAGTNVSSLYCDRAGFVWAGGGGSGLVRFDTRTGRFKHYRHNANDPRSLLSDNVGVVFGDRGGQMWVGGQYGLNRFDPARDAFTTFQPDPAHPASLLNWIWSIYQDRAGALWLGTFAGALIRFDDNTAAFKVYPPDARDPHKLNGGGITTIHEDRTGTLWLGGFDGLYRFDRQSETFDRYTETRGLPSSTIRCIKEDKTGRLWLSTQRGISRFDPKAGAFRNYDVTDGLQSNEFSDGCFESQDGELFFGGSNGFNAFFPESIRDNPYVPLVVITSFRVFNEPVPIGGRILKKAIPYVDSLTLSHADGVFSFEFAALSYANSQRNRYRYKLDNFDRGWTEVGSKQRMATYTNLSPGEYVFHVQGSNSDGVWNEKGTALRVLITPPWYGTTWFRALGAALVLALLWAAWQFRIGQLQHEFNMRLEGRVEERMRIARELHDTLLQSVQGLMYSFQAARNLLPGRAEEAMNLLDDAIREGDEAIAEGRNAIQGLRANPLESNLEHLLTTAGNEVARSSSTEGNAPEFRVTVEGARQPLPELLQDEVYRIARELLRNAFHHAHATRIEVETAYDAQFFRLRIRDDGRGIDRKVVEAGAREGHWGLPGVRERATRIGGRLQVWSEHGAGTEVELTIPARIAYATARRRNGFRLFVKRKPES